jgi:hypothetical protein
MKKRVQSSRSIQALGIFYFDAMGATALDVYGLASGWVSRRRVTACRMW